MSFKTVPTFCMLFIYSDCVFPFFSLPFSLLLKIVYISLWRLFRFFCRFSFRLLSFWFLSYYRISTYFYYRLVFLFGVCTKCKTSRNGVAKNKNWQENRGHQRENNEIHSDDYVCVRALACVTAQMSGSCIL